MKILMSSMRFSLALLIFSLHCWAEEGERRTLAGTKSFYVMVDSTFAPPISGLSNDIIKADIEKQLRSFGIAVDVPPDLPPVVLRITCFGSSGFLGVSLKVVQHVALLRDPQIRVLIETWGVSDTATAQPGTTFSAQSFRDAVQKLMNQLTLAWLAENLDVRPPVIFGK